MKIFFQKYFRFIFEGILFNPIWIVERRVCKKIKFAIKASQIVYFDKWLDVGCGLRPYESSFPADSYIGVDIETSGRVPTLKAPDFFYNGRELPFPEGSFDGVLCTQVLEHVSDPRNLLAEMHRVIKPGGGLILSLPFVWQEHEEPYDFFRFTRFGIVDLLGQSGFEVESVERDTGAIETLAVALNVYIIHNLVPPFRGFGRLTALGLCFPIQCAALALQMILPDRGQFYVNLVIRARKADRSSSGSKC